MASRTKLSILNASTNLLFFFTSSVMVFFSRKIFLTHLGNDFVGLIGTIGEMLGLMNLTELGIGTAVGVTLYKHIHDQDKQKINEIISVFGFLYRRVGLVILGVSFIVSGLFPFIFKNVDIPFWQIYYLFYVYLFSALLGYFVNYRQIIISASQKNYHISIVYNLTILSKTALQMLVLYFGADCFWWITLELLSTIGMAFAINYKIKHLFPWVESSVKLGQQLFKEYISLWTRTKQVFVLKMAHVINNQTTQTLIFSFTSLSVVSFYGNYSLVFNKSASLIDSVFTGMEASVGNLIAEGNVEHIKLIFWKLMGFRYSLAIMLTSILYFTVNPLISLWLGSQYILENSIIIIMLANLFINQTRVTVDSFKNGYGLFQDTWAPIAEVLINLSIAISMGSLFGLQGVLLGFTVSSILIKMIWKPYFLFSRGFNGNVIKEYFPKILNYLFCLLLNFLFIKFFTDMLFVDEKLDLTLFISKVFTVALISLVTTVLYLSLTDKYSKLFFIETWKMIYEKIVVKSNE